MLLRELFEAKINEVAIIFGRFNPPHKGHKAAWEMASKSPVWYVGTNKSTVGPKDPLPFDVKIKAMEAVWPEVASHIVAETSWLTLASKVYEKHGDVILYILTDEDWVTKALVQYNGKEGPHGFYQFSKIEQKPTPRLSSATALRDAVTKGDRDAFSDAAGVSADLKVAGKPFFDLVAEYLLPYANAPAKPKKSKVAEARKSSWEKMAKPFKGTSKDLDKSDERARAALSGLKKAGADYQAIVDKDKKKTEDETEEGWKSKLAGAAMVGLGALGAAGAAKASDSDAGMKAPTQVSQQSGVKWLDDPTVPDNLPGKVAGSRFPTKAPVGTKYGSFLNDKGEKINAYVDHDLTSRFVPDKDGEWKPQSFPTNAKVGTKYGSFTNDKGEKIDKYVGYDLTTHFQKASDGPWEPKNNSTKEDAAGVGIITKQNTTADVGPGTIKKNLKAYKL